MKRVVLIAVVGAVIALALTGARRPASPAGPSSEAGPPVTLIPVVHLKASSDIPVELEFENISTQPIKYLEVGEGYAYIRYGLLRDGRALPTAAVTPPPLGPKQVRELKPGQRLRPHIWKLRNMYRDLKPGRYLFVAQYGEGSQYGLTPMRIEQKVYVIIEE